MRVSKFLDATNQILRWLLPWACAGCRTPLDSAQDHGFCGECWLHLPRILGFVCFYCGVPLKAGGNQCFSCRPSPSKILIRSATTYSGAMRSAIHRFKYAGRKSLSTPLAQLMESAWRRFPELHAVDRLVPVPLHPSTDHDRGYNQAALLAQRLSLLLAIPILEGLVRRRKTKPQFSLRKDERLTNLKEAFHFQGSSLEGLKLLLVDDVATTGATLLECRAALRRAGASRVQALVLARDV